MGSDELDRLIDEALSSYSTQEPRLGMDRRVLARSASVRPRVGWTLATAAVMVLCTGVVLMKPRPRTEQVRPPDPLPAAWLHAPAPVVTVADPQPKRHRFPLPLTREERAWLAAADEGILQAEPEQVEPIQIEDLTIPPIETEGGE